MLSLQRLSSNCSTGATCYCTPTARGCTTLSLTQVGPIHILHIYPATTIAESFKVYFFSSQSDVFFHDWKDMDERVFWRWSINHGRKRYLIKWVSRLEFNIILHLPRMLINLLDENLVQNCIFYGSSCSTMSQLTLNFRLSSSSYINKHDKLALLDCVACLACLACPTCCKTSRDCPCFWN